MKDNLTLIDCLYIHSGGGKTIIDEVISKIASDKSKKDFFFLIDSRLKRSYNSYILKKINFIFLDSNLFSRTLFYIKKGNLFSRYICLGNVPPPILTKKISSIFNLNIDILPNKSIKSNKVLISKKFNEITGVNPPLWDEMLIDFKADCDKYSEIYKK